MFKANFKAAFGWFFGSVIGLAAGCEVLNLVSGFKKNYKNASEEN